jgi:uncharacterized protein YyaL (SSP411 family)
MLLGRPDWIEMAERAFRFITESVSRDGRLGHALRQGKTVHPGFSSDIAAMAKAALALNQATQDTAYLDAAARFLTALETHHSDGRGGYHFTADDAEPLIVRKSDRVDDASPNPHALAVDGLVRLWALTGDDAYRDRADAILEAASAAIAANVFGTASLLSALDLRLGVQTVVIMTTADDDGALMRDAVRATWTASIVLDVRSGDEPLPAGHPAHGKSAILGKATAYVCREGACSLPLTDAEALRTRLEAAHG